VAENRKSRFDLIYETRAEDYHALVTREDREGNLPAALRSIVDFAGTTVVEMGAGTGRLTGIVAAMAAAVRAFDRSAHMLGRAAEWLNELSLGNVTLAVAENRAIPLPDGSADVVIEGWSFGHAATDAGEAWEDAVLPLLGEAERLAKPGGSVILIETMGTGSRQPAAPGPVLPAFYAWLESRQGFRGRWIRTDYLFADLAEAERLVTFFFGSMTAHEVLASGQVVVPECTGIWWKRSRA
jgi:SAM-dependent methyltransferase